MAEQRLLKRASSGGWIPGRGSSIDPGQSQAARHVFRKGQAKSLLDRALLRDITDDPVPREVASGKESFRRGCCPEGCIQPVQAQAQAQAQAVAVGSDASGQSCGALPLGLARGWLAGEAFPNPAILGAQIPAPAVKPRLYCQVPPLCGPAATGAEQKLRCAFYPALHAVAGVLSLCLVIG